MSAHCDECEADLCYGDNGEMFCEVCEQRDKIKELEAQLAEAREALDERLVSSVDDKTVVGLLETRNKRIEGLEAEAAAMREALEQVEWVPLGNLDDCRCPWCFAYSYGHEQDCKRQAALSSSERRF